MSSHKTRAADPHALARDTLLRQWRMLREIPRYPRRITTADLVKRLDAAEFHVTQRTIQRDLNKLSSVLPLLSDNAKPQGWSWQADVPQLDLPALEPQAALMFHLAEKYLRPVLPASTVDYLAPWFKTADRVLDASGNGLSAWRDKVRILPPGQPLLPPAVQPHVPERVTQGLLQGKRILVRYRPRGSEREKEYLASPRGLVVRDHVMYLVCTLRDYTDIKQLVLHRVLSAELTDEPVLPLPGFNLDEYIAAGEFGWPTEGRKIRLVADFDQRAAYVVMERPLSNSQTVEVVSDDTIRLTADVIDTYELKVWLRGFGSRVWVREPTDFLD
jgi:predicted DNA-binding transcriptional regulator YafY